MAIRWSRQTDNRSIIVPTRTIKIASKGNFWSLFTLGWFVFLVGSLFLTLYLLGALEDADELHRISGAYAWIIPSHLPVMMMCSVGGRKLGATFVSNVSSGSSLKESVRSTLTNVALVNALIMSVSLAVWCIEAPGDLDDLRVHWFHLCNVSSALFASVGTITPVTCLMITDGLSDEAMYIFLTDENHGGVIVIGYPICFMCISVVELLLGLSFFTYVTYGDAAGTTAVFSTLGALTFLFVNYVTVSQFPNVVDGREAALRESAQMKFEKHQWWFYICPHNPELDETLVPAEVVSNDLFGEARTINGEHFTKIARVDDDVLLVKRVDEHLHQLLAGKHIVELVAPGTNQQHDTKLHNLQTLSKAGWMDLLKEGLLMPVPGKNTFVAMAGDDDMVRLKFSLCESTGNGSDVKDIKRESKVVKKRSKKSRETVGDPLIETE